MLVFHHSTCIEPFSLPMKSDLVMLKFKVSSESLQKVFRFKCEPQFQHIFHWKCIKWSLESASLCSRNKSWRVGSMRCPDGLKNHKLMNHANKQTRHFSDFRFSNWESQYPSGDKIKEVSVVDTASAAKFNSHSFLWQNKYNLPRNGKCLLDSSLNHVQGCFRIENLI